MDTGGELMLVKGYVGENSARLSGHQAVINSQNTLSHLEPLSPRKHAQITCTVDTGGTLFWKQQIELRSAR